MVNCTPFYAIEKKYHVLITTPKRLIQQILLSLLKKLVQLKIDLVDCNLSAHQLINLC